MTDDNGDHKETRLEALTRPIYLHDHIGAMFVALWVFLGFCTLLSWELKPRPEYRIVAFGQGEQTHYAVESRIICGWYSKVWSPAPAGLESAREWVAMRKRQDELNRKFGRAQWRVVE